MFFLLVGTVKVNPTEAAGLGALYPDFFTAMVVVMMLLALRFISGAKPGINKAS